MVSSLSVPRFHVPSVFGVRPDNEFFLPLPVEGERVCLNCLNPPPGTRFDAATGSLRGRIAASGVCRVEFEAENSAGRAACTVQIIVGEKIQLTPPMGWNSWYCFSEGVSDVRIRAAADALVDRGLAAHGWNFVNIDDCWQGKRGGRFGALQGNERFPDMGRWPITFTPGDCGLVFIRPRGSPLMPDSAEEAPMAEPRNGCFCRNLSGFSRTRFSGVIPGCTN